MRVLAFSSCRADDGPLRPVVRAMQDAGINAWLANLTFCGNPVDRYETSADEAVEEIARNTPDWIILLGDRYETYAAAGAAVVMGIPIAHIHGGEVTLGSFDNKFRHAISNLADIHFVANERAAMKIWGMGIARNNVHVVGAPGLDNVAEVKASLGPVEKKRQIVVTYHPATAVNESVIPLLSALTVFEREGYRMIFTGVSPDPGRNTVDRCIRAAMDLGMNAEIREDMTAKEYLTECAQSALVVGNSSSGIIEMPTLGVPSVDVGERQRGRWRGPSVYDAKCETGDIVRAMRDALEHTEPFTNPYGEPGASKRIADIMLSLARERKAA